MNKRNFPTLLISLLICAALMLLGGCRKPVDPARITIAVDGQDFSDALVYIDGKQSGHITQTLIKANGELYINGELSATLPAPEDPGEAREDDTYSGVLDSMILAPGEHTVALQRSDGKTIQIMANITPGYHLYTYLPEEGIFKWDTKVLKVSPGDTITVK